MNTYIYIYLGVNGYHQLLGYSHSSKYLLLCSTEERNSYRLRTSDNSWLNYSFCSEILLCFLKGWEWPAGNCWIWWTEVAVAEVQVQLFVACCSRVGWRGYSYCCCCFWKSCYWTGEEVKGHETEAQVMGNVPYRLTWREEVQVVHPWGLRKQQGTSLAWTMQIKWRGN